MPADKNDERSDGLSSNNSRGNEGKDRGEDGRKSRRSQNRIRVLEAFLELIEEYAGLPSPEKIAEQAEVSRRSIFRYFDSLDELVAEAYHHQIELLQEKFSPPEPLQDPQELNKSSLKEFVVYLSSIYEYTASMRKVLSEKGLPAEILDKLNRMRSQTLKNRLSRHFDVVLEEEMVSGNMDNFLYGLEAALSPESWDYLRGPCDLSRERARKVWIQMLARFFKH